MAALVGVGAAFLLAGCNPLTQTPFIPEAPTWSTAKFGYEGPGDAWIEARVGGIEGYEVSTRAAVWVPQPAPVPEPRRCVSGTDRTLVVTCDMSYPEFPFTGLHRADLDAPGVFWPAILLHPGEQAQVMVYCSQGGTPVACPATTRVTARTVDAAGALTGDLRGIT